MSSPVSNTVKILGLIVLILLLFMGGCKLLVREIFNRQDCERFNIDNIEVRTGVNIPAIIECDCEVVGNTKTSWFIIDSSKVNLNTYVTKNGFVKTDSNYTKVNRSQHTNWIASLNPKSAKLSFKIEYLE